MPAVRRAAHDADGCVGPSSRRVAETLIESRGHRLFLYMATEPTATRSILGIYPVRKGDLFINMGINTHSSGGGERSKGNLSDTETRRKDCEMVAILLPKKICGTERQKRLEVDEDNQSRTAPEEERRQTRG